MFVRLNSQYFNVGPQHNTTYEDDKHKHTQRLLIKSKVQKDKNLYYTAHINHRYHRYR